MKSKEDREERSHRYFYSSSLFLVLVRSTSTLLDEVHLHKGHPLSNNAEYKCVFCSKKNTNVFSRVP